MTLFYDAATVERHATPEFAIAAMEAGLVAERDGRMLLPARHDLPTVSGFLRIMPAILEDVMGLKVMALVNGLGTRYVVLLHEVATGELVALFDAEELTRIRTAAFTSLAGKAMVAGPPETIGVLGSGFEAAGHVRALARCWPLRRVTVYSPNQVRRARFAEGIAAELGIRVVVAESAREAVDGEPVALLATKSKRPVADGAWFAPGAVVLSIGSTRPDLRELDEASFARAAAVVTDAPAQVLAESGDVMAAVAAGAVEPDCLVSLGGFRSTPRPVLQRPRDLLVFKSVGTALQDLALARALHHDGGCRADAREVGEVGRLKSFAADVPLGQGEDVTQAGLRLS
jgi:alanine dehydrogenase